MFPIAFMLPAVLVLLVALYVAVREAAAAGSSLATGGPGPLLTAVGEIMLIAGAIAMFTQGRFGGLVLAPMPAFIVFMGGSALFFVGMGFESRHALKR